MPAFTLTLDTTTTEEIEALVKPVGGTVGGYARVIVSEMMALPPGERELIRQQIGIRLRQLRERDARAAAAAQSPLVTT